jgi:membrane protein DedA with SNARE-associated domain
MINLAALLRIDPATIEPLLAMIRAFAPWALAIVGVVGFIKSLPVVALFLPSTLLFVAIGGAYAASGGSFVSLWLAAALGATAGDCLCYAGGRIAKGDVGKMWPLTKYPDALPKGEQVFRKYGVLSVLGAKFVYGLRPFIPVVAGIYGMPFALFASATSLSSLVWAGIGISAGFGLPLLFK